MYTYCLIKRVLLRVSPLPLSLPLPLPPLSSLPLALPSNPPYLTLPSYCLLNRVLLRVLVRLLVGTERQNFQILGTHLLPATCLISSSYGIRIRSWVGVWKKHSTYDPSPMYVIRTSFMFK